MDFGKDIIEIEVVNTGARDSSFHVGTGSYSREAGIMKGKYSLTIQSAHLKSEKEVFPGGYINAE